MITDVEIQNDENTQEDSNVLFCLGNAIVTVAANSMSAVMTLASIPVLSIAKGSCIEGTRSAQQFGTDFGFFSAQLTNEPENRAPIALDMTL